jgi:hypothetical protein
MGHHDPDRALPSRLPSSAAPSMTAVAGRPAAGRARRQPGPDGSPDLRAILDVPAGIADPVLDSPRLRQQINAGRYPVLVAIELAREMGDPRAEQWAQLVAIDDHGDGDG